MKRRMHIAAPLNETLKSVCLFAQNTNLSYIEIIHETKHSVKTFETYLGTRIVLMNNKCTSLIARTAYFRVKHGLN